MSIFSDAVGFLAEIMRTVLAYCFDLTQMLGLPSYGIAIVILTLGIKLILMPLAIKQIKSMKGMQELQPRMKELQKKYKNDPKKMQQEIGKLYKEMGVNPLSGCLPLLVQMPFLIAIFYALQGFHYDPAYVSFLWLPSLGEPDPIYLLPLMSAASTYIMQKQTMQANAEGAAAQQQKVMQIFMPLFIGYISINFPSGLVIYWVLSNLFQMGQQWFMFRDEKKGALAK